jgi:hypothetical protein
VVYGLPALANHLLYFVQAPTDGSESWATDDGAELVFLLCEWNIAHM